MKIIYGVSASIAIYKSCEIVRLLQKEGFDIHVVMTQTASQWISPVVFTALSNNPVYVHDTDHGAVMAHIELRENCDLMIVAPASADFISQAAVGSAPNLLSTLLLSFSGPKWIAPSMNPVMFKHPAVQFNLTRLREYGYRILSPETGEALCGDLGEGKMASVEYIVEQICNIRMR
ncbi:MAG: phosphopantothenoylcysteine decarboxylase [Spirochaetia bacterium]|nr:phosphopantothenoylcysteine decarboxylase [Spirochaetia bacterium]